MNITVYSRNRLYETFSKWDVPRDFADPMANYLIYGYDPGGFFTALLANDFFAAIQRSHVGNNIESLKCLVGWINDCMPPEAYSSYDRVSEWRHLHEHSRRAILEKYELVYTEQEEIMLTLRSESTDEPVLY
jgi:hypothetical protein